VWSYAFRVEALPPEAYLVLLALLAQAAHQGDPLAAVELSAADERHAASVTTDALLRRTRRLRRTSGRTPFPVEIDEDALDAGEFGVRVEFAGSLRPDTRELVEERLAAWDETRIFGGFLFDFSEQEATGNAGSIAVAEPNAVQLWITDYFEGERTALDMLANLAHDLHDHQQPVHRLLVE
jgi:hypothetical protein